MKKFLIAILVLLVLSGGGVLYLYMQTGGDEISNPQEAIPASAAIILSYPNLSQAWEVFEDQDYYDVFLSIEDLESFFSRNLLVDSLLRNNQDIKKMLGLSELWSSYHTTGKDSLHVFHAIKLHGTSEHHALEVINSALSELSIRSEQVVENLKVSKLVFENPYSVIFITVSHGLVLVSTNLDLLKVSLEQLNNGTSLKDDKDFVKASASAGKNVEANLYLNYSRLSDYLKRYLKPEITSTSGLFNEVASWAELDVNLKSKGLTFNGFSYTTDSLPKYLNLFLNQTPQNISFPEILPSSTATFIFFGINDVISLAGDYRKLLQQKGALEDMEVKLDSLNKEYNVDLEQNLLAWMGNEFGLCITEPASSTFSEHSYIVFKARSEPLAKKLLSDFSDLLSKKKGKETEVTQTNGVEVRKLELSGIISTLMGEGFEQFENPYYAIVNGYVVFAISVKAMTEYLRHVQADRTLDKELGFSEFAESLSSTFNVFTYHHLSRSKYILESYLNRESKTALDGIPELQKNFEAIGSQLTSTGQSFYTNLFLRYNPQHQSSKQTHWTANMKAKAQIRPVFVKNHLSKEQEVLVQDELNNLYLFNKFGQELFSRELPEAILSSPVQVDAFKNGKLQYVFNTKNFIFLIDRNGKNLEGFPIELASPAQTNISVVEYDGKRDYRLLITCKNKHIYNYNIFGKKVEGWKHNKASDPTIHSFIHLSNAGKDYLITGESNGKIHLLDRKGKNRVRVKKRVNSSVNNILQGFSSTEKAFAGVYLTDETGKIHRVALTGEVQTMVVGRYSPKHRFFVADLNNDGGPEFIFIDLNILQVFNYKKEKVFEQRIDPSATEPFLINMRKGKMGVGFCFDDSQQLILYDPNGQLAKGFPSSGNSEFDFVVTDSERLIVSAGTGSTLTIQIVH